MEEPLGTWPFVLLIVRLHAINIFLFYFSMYCDIFDMIYCDILTY